MSANCSDCLPCRQGKPCADTAHHHHAHHHAPRRITNFMGDCSADFAAFAQTPQKDWARFSELVERCVYMEDNADAHTLDTIESLGKSLRAGAWDHKEYLKWVDQVCMTNGCPITRSYVHPYVVQMKRDQLTHAALMAGGGMIILGTTTVSDMLTFEQKKYAQMAVLGLAAMSAWKGLKTL